MPPITFEIIASDKNSRARAGIIKTPHGNIETPYVIPVATRGEIKSLKNEDLELLKVQCLLANTYHMNLLLKGKNKDLHSVMKFNKPIFTDSGGFQAFSLGLGREQSTRKIGFFPGERISKLKGENYAKITEKGVFFKSIYDETEQFIGPKESMQIQSDLGSDIIMAFDECTSAASDKSYIKESMERSHRWELESLKYHNPKQALYGIVHGGWFKDLRLASTKYVSSLPFDGIAIGGSLGKTKKNMYKILDWITPKLDNKPRHMLGIGWLDDIFECVERGIDTFDCVEMTRIARHGSLYISPKAGGSLENKFRIDIAKSIYNSDNSPIDPSCDCFTCKNYTKSEIRSFYKQISIEKESNKRLPKEKQKIDAKMIYGRLATIHNIHFILSLTSQIRNSIIEGNGSFQKLKSYWLG